MQNPKPFAKTGGAMEGEHRYDEDGQTCRRVRRAAHYVPQAREGLVEENGGEYFNLNAKSEPVHRAGDVDLYREALASVWQELVDSLGHEGKVGDTAVEWEAFASRMREVMQQELYCLVLSGVLRLAPQLEREHRFFRITNLDNDDELRRHFLQSFTRPLTRGDKEVALEVRFRVEQWLRISWRVLHSHQLVQYA
jgi:hypothetical protein